VVTGSIQRVWEEGKRVIVRHLLMPGHYDCCTVPVLQWLAGLPGIEVSLLTQYLAPAHAPGELAAPLDPAEIDAAFVLAHRLNLRLVA
jgi:putative pyruvate formate lyase activating enzyme